MIHSRNRLDVQNINEGLKTVKHLAPVEFFLAAGITDGAGEKSNRLVLRAQGDDQFYFAFPQGTEAGMHKPAPWLQRALVKVAPVTVQSLPEDVVTDIPTGNPMES